MTLTFLYNEEPRLCDGYNIEIQGTFTKILFLINFCAFGFKVLKSAHMTYKNSFKNQEGYQKMQKFMFILNPLKKFFFKCAKKIISKTNLTIMSESEKVLISVTFLLIIFLCAPT
jgi:hypothetical protein